jgi:hypothetical protein
MEMSRVSELRQIKPDRVPFNDPDHDHLSKPTLAGYSSVTHSCPMDKDVPFSIRSSIHNEGSTVINPRVGPKVIASKESEMGEVIDERASFW